MKVPWVSIAVITGIGLVTTISYFVVGERIDYEFISYQIQYLDKTGITIRVIFSLSNPFPFDLQVWNQTYDVILAGEKFSEITSLERYRLPAESATVLPLDIRVQWKDIQTKLAPLTNQASLSSLGNIPLLIKGKLSVRIGKLLNLKKVPVRASMRLETLLP